MTTTTEIEIFQFQNVPSAEEGGLIVQADVRVVQLDGEPWFVAKDVCEVLGLKSDHIARDVDDDDKGFAKLATPGGDQQLRTVNESGLYSLILRSRKPEAKAFKKWVTAVVLPTIRKTGGAYIAPGSKAELNLMDPATALETIKAAVAIAEEAQAKLVVAEAEKAVLEAKVEEDKPMVHAAEEFFGEEGLCSLRDAARKLGVPPLTFNDILREWNWIDKDGTGAKAYAVSSGYMKNRIYVHPGSGAGTTQGRITNKGLERAAIKLEQQGVWRGYNG
ncbi:putative antirepressor [Mycobacterium phage Adzzy]|uniref:putative antirepressor n=1 Tax=Mycobacterium phage Adzzy TaxID=1383059 RepID=UPI0003881C6D|nr:putative antirepressor [Mycobacterium phage Adzzy]AGT14325.1 putative antirepressor [Mycobacterium phage Adzzy]